MGVHIEAVAGGAHRGRASCGAWDLEKKCILAHISLVPDRVRVVIGGWIGLGLGLRRRFRLRLTITLASGLTMTLTFALRFRLRLGL